MASFKFNEKSCIIRVYCGLNAGHQVIKTKTVKIPKLGSKNIEKWCFERSVLFENEVKNGVSFDIRNIKFSDFCDLFLENISISLKSHTINGYRWLSIRCKSQLGHLNISKITSLHIQEFLKYLYSAPRLDGNSGSLSIKSIREHIFFLSDIFNYAKRLGYITINPCDNVYLPRKVKSSHKILNIEEAIKFLDCLLKIPISDHNYVYAVFFTLAVFTGFRRGELLGLTASDFDFEKKLVSVNRTVYYNKILGVYVDTPKSRASYRTLLLPEFVVDMVKKLKLKAYGRLFTFHPNTPYNFLQRFCLKNNLTLINIHSLRHLNASLMIKASANVKSVQTSLGHSSATTTLDIYSHEFSTVNSVSAELLPGLLGLEE